MTLPEEQINLIILLNDLEKDVNLKIFDIFNKTGCPSQWGEFVDTSRFFDGRMKRIGETNIEQGFMWLVSSIASKG